MSTKTYRGSCKCKRVTFEADIDFATAGTGKCNCTSCFKRRSWSTQVKPEAFRALSGLEDLSGYKVGEKRGFGGFCKSCGVTCFDWVAKAEWNDGERVSISVATLDDADP